MSHSESKPTAAQVALLEFITPLEAGDIFNDLTTTLQLSLAGFADPDRHSVPSASTITSWHRHVELLGHLHSVAMEGRKE